MSRIDSLLHDVRLTSEPNHRLMQQVRTAALALGDDVTEEVKYGGILFSRGQPFGGVYAHARHVTVEFSHGATLADVHGLLEGKGKLRRHIRLDAPGDCETKHVPHYLNLAARAAGVPG